MGYPGFIGFFIGLVQPLFPYTFDPLLTPLLGIGSPLTGARLTVTVLSIVLAGVLSLLYYIFMDVEEYQRLKEEREALNEKMSAAKEEGDMDTANEHMKEMAGMQKEFMLLMLKPMLVSMVVFFLILPWMYTTFTPVVTLQAQDNTTATGTLTYNGIQQPLTVSTTNSTPTVTVDGTAYHPGDRFRVRDMHWKVKQVSTDDGQPQSVRIAAEIIPLPFSLPFIGDELSWLGAYILISLPFTIIFRKKLGIH